MTSGSLRIFGLDIRNDWRQIKGRIGIFQQENSLDPDLSVQQNLEVFARYFDIQKKAAKETTRSLLRFISMEHRKDDRITALSGGLFVTPMFLFSGTFFPLENLPPVGAEDGPHLSARPSQDAQTIDKIAQNY